MSILGVVLVCMQSKCGKIRTRITPNTDTLHLVIHFSILLLGNCPNTEFFLVCIFPHSDWIRRDTHISPYSVRMRENTDQNNSEYRSSVYRNLQKRAVRFWSNDYEILYKELLLESPTSSMNIKRLRAPCVDLYKTVNKLNPNFMKDLFKLQFTNRSFCEKYKMDMTIPEFNQVSYGKKSLRTFGSKLFYHIILSLQNI